MEEIITQWIMEKEGHETLCIQEVVDDGETYFDVCRQMFGHWDAWDTYDDYREAIEAVNNFWANEDDEKKRPINDLDTIENLGLQGMFGV